MLLPTGNNCLDGWITGAALAPLTERLKFLLALRPGMLTPALAARQSAALDRISDGRLLLNIVTGGLPKELAGDGLLLDHDERYEQTDEFLTIWRGLFNGGIDFSGRHLTARNAKLGQFDSVQTPYPPLWFGGSSPAGIEVAAGTWTPISPGLNRRRRWPTSSPRFAPGAAARSVARLRFGLRVHLIVRETDAEAWEAAEQADQPAVGRDDRGGTGEVAREDFDSVGQLRQMQLHGGQRDRLEVSPNLWAGVGSGAQRRRHCAGRQSADGGRARCANTRRWASAR